MTISRGMLVFFLGMLALWAVRAADALPMFARDEGVACQTCHFRMPELNAEGRAFARQGFREVLLTPAAAAQPAASVAPPGQPAAAKPSLGEPLNLAWANYLTVLAIHAFSAGTGQKATASGGEVDLWAGGPLDPHWSGIANAIFDVDQSGASVQQAYAQYLAIQGPTRFNSVRMGQFSPFAILLNQGNFGLSVSTPVMLSTPPDTGSSWTPSTLMRGVEVGMVDQPHWNAYLGAVQPSLTEVPVGSQGTDFYASGELLSGAAGNSLTAFGYWGTAVLPPNNTNAAFHRLGLFATVYPGSENKLVGGIMQGSDETADGRQLDDAGFFLLGEHLLSDRWSAYGRLDWYRMDLSAGGSQETYGPTVGVSMWAASQLQVTLETQFLDTTNAQNQRSITAQLLYAF